MRDDDCYVFALSRDVGVRAALETLGEVQNEFTRSEGARRIVNSSNGVGAIEDWAVILSSFQNPSLAARTVQLVGARFARDGVGEQAVSWARKQDASLTKARALLGVAQGMLGLWPGHFPGQRGP